MTLVAGGSADPAGFYQQGGTCTGIIENIVGRIIDNGTDESGLGRWSYVKLAGRNNRQLCIATAYRPGKKNQTGNATVMAQQHRLLKQKGVREPRPRKQWMKDMAPKFKEWKEEGKVLLLVDANTGLDKTDFSAFMAETGLCDIIGAHHGINTPNTHANDSYAIDFILGTVNIVEMICKCGMEKFYNGIHSDHCGIFADINILHLLQGEIHQTPSVCRCKYHTKYKKRGRRYRCEVSQNIAASNIVKQLESLEKKTVQEFTEAHQKELEDIDKAVTTAMLTPEEKCWCTTQHGGQRSCMTHILL
eukprot:10354486-Ditylum_brightwellii.AAC.1